MSKIKLIVIMLSIFIFISCGSSTSKHPANAKGFAAIEKDIKDKFGSNAYYVDLKISHDNSTGNIIGLTVTDAPESLKMGSYVFSNHTSWEQDSEVRLEVPEGAKAADFMFQLNDKINLIKLGELVELSSKKLTIEKNIDNPVLDMAFIKFPKNGDMKKVEYIISLQPEKGGTTFSFYYTLNGDLIKMDY